MKKVFVIFALLLLIAVVGWMSLFDKKDAVINGKPIVRIGVQLPLSGETLVAAGQSMKTTIDMAKEDLAKMNTKYDYQFIIEDNQFDAKRAAMVTNKFVSVDNVDALISVGSRIGNVINETANREKILHLSACASDPNVSNGDYNFINWTTPVSEAEKMVEEISRLGIDSVAIMVENDAALISMSDNVKKGLDKFGIKYIEQISVQNNKDFYMNIAKAEQMRPDIYIVLLYDSSMVVFIKQLRENKIDTMLTSIETFGFIDDKGIVEGEWYIDAAEGTDEFFAKLADRTGNNNIFGAANVYDSIMILVQSFENAENKDEVNISMRNIKKYNGLIGEVIQDDRGIFNSEAIVKIIKNGKSVRK